MAKRATSSAADTLLVELLTEELPPKSLSALSTHFADEILNGLVRHQLKLRDFAGRRIFATPRRLATLIPDVLAHGQDRSNEVQGPSVTAPREAVAGFARKNGVSVEALAQQDTPRGRVFVARTSIKGASLLAVLPEIVGEAVKKLPVRKAMRWGSGEALFARPVHGLVMMHGKRVIPGAVLDAMSGNSTSGHRFMGAPGIRLSSADDYEVSLLKKGRVIADFVARRAEIDRQLQAEAKRQRAVLGEYQDLLDEVTALVELPSVYVCAFEASFLEVPHECLILTMRQNQKYFPLFASDGKLLPKFLVVSNMRVKNPQAIVSGNERVVRPRLEDARFFFNQDRKVRLDTRVPQLANVVYHNKLGSQLDRMERIKLLTGEIARALGADSMLAERAAELSKADLLTGMVGEFPELQGTMGRYYALHDGEKKEVALAIAQHYKPRFSGDAVPEDKVACAVALADKLDTVVAMLGIGERPTGDKDPFALRRQGLGIVRILIETPNSLDLFVLVEEACRKFPKGRLQASTVPEVRQFIVDRMKNLLREGGEETSLIEAVVGQTGGRIYQLPKRLDATKKFMLLPEAKDLAVANKRVLNIIRKNEEIGYKFSVPDKTLMSEQAEIALSNAVEHLSPIAQKHFDAGEYEINLRLLAKIKPDVDRFFDKVMVMVDDPKIRNNRAALLQQLGILMNQVADISKLAVEK